MANTKSGNAPVLHERKGASNGIENWSKEQIYEGEFFKNIIHGEGVYHWNKSRTYEGPFFANCKQGYGTMSFSDGSFFEGLFIKNKPFGPGILTQANGCQNAGFWVGNDLVRLSSAVDFIVPRLAETLLTKIKLLPFRCLHLFPEAQHCDSITELIRHFSYPLDFVFDPFSRIIYDERSAFFEKAKFEEKYFGVKLLSGKEAGGIEANSRGSIKRSPHQLPWPFDLPLGEGGLWFAEGVCEQKKVISWNPSELCADLLQEIYRHRTFEDNVSFKIAKLMLGVRTAFRKAGEKEIRCLQFLKICSVGPSSCVKKILCDFAISQELMDARGNNGLIFAAATDQHDTIDILADYGVDVNAFNDEMLTPLNLCLLRRLAQENNIIDWGAAFLPAVPVNTFDKGYGKDMDDLYGSICNFAQIFEDDETFAVEDIEKSIKNELWDSEKSTLFQKNNNSLDHCSRNSSPKEITSSVSVDPGFSYTGMVKKKTDEQIFWETSKEKYFFELRPEVNFPNKKEENLRNNKSELDAFVKKEFDANLEEKIENIDKTIKKLLKRGADPNLSEVPKPSIHLGIFTKDVNVVRALLAHGANPNSQLHPNEGLLTPLHVLVLLPPVLECVDICELLLKFGADPELETSPEYCISEVERSLLQPSQGRTPLQLLCMRSDLERADPQGYLLKIGLALARVSNKKKFYSGHSYLTLAMISGNINLFHVLLDSKYFNPNEVLNKGLGTALHVLVSTPFQIKTTYDCSVRTCDLLISSGANPLKEFKTTSSLDGTCLDYGFREIEKEKMKRKVNTFDKKETKVPKLDKSEDRDHLQDHVKVVEYLSKIADEMAKNLNRPAARQSKESKQKKKSGKFYLDENDKNPRKAKGKNQVSISRRDITLKQPMTVKVSFKKLAGSKNEDIESNQSEKSKSQTGERGEQNAKDEKKLSFERNKYLEKKEKGSEKPVKAKCLQKSVYSFLKSNPQEKKEKTFEKTRGFRNKNTRLKKDLFQKANFSFLNKTKKEIDPPTEVYPEKVLQMFGNCMCLDIDDLLLLPYVVLRDGNLYYRFQGKASRRKEQYSLI